jgi:hypothetical protein
MRYPMRIAPLWRWLFALFGWTSGRSYVEIDEQAPYLRFGAARKRIPLTEIARVARRHWPLYFGLGAKLGPSGGVSYVGSSAGVVQIDFLRPRPLKVWGPISNAHARCVIVSLENADRFIEDLRTRIQPT